MTAARDHAWPAPSVGEALAALALRVGLSATRRTSTAPVATDAFTDDDAVSRFVEASGAAVGVDAVRSSLRYGDIEEGLRRSHPALVALPAGAGFLAVLRGGRRWLLVLAPDRLVHRVPAAVVADELRRAMEGTAGADADRVLQHVGVTGPRSARARRGILEARLVGQRLECLWLLRRASFAPFRDELRDARISLKLAGLFTAYLAQYLLTIGSWALLGRSVLAGQAEGGWLLAWVLLLLTQGPVRVLSTWLQGRLAVGLGVALKRRTLAGALRQDPDLMRREGAGQIMGRAIEASGIDQVALHGGLVSLFSLLELAGATVVVGLGAGGLPQAAVLCAWSLVTIALALRFRRHHQAWVAARLRMTRELIEAMVGNRTRLVQERPDRWHDAEDAELERFVALSRAADDSVARLFIMPRAWQVIGLLTLAPAFIAGADPAALAIGIGGVQLAFQALTKLADSSFELMTAVVAWERVGPLFEAAARRDEPGEPEAALAPARLAPGTVALDATELTYTHRGRMIPAVRQVSLRVRAGERVLLEGPSGGGKSTLTALLAGARVPDDGLLLAGGLDRLTLGADGWRRRVAAAPQFHENHILTETFAFNVLLSRGWPPRAQDLRDAQAVSEELGLGPLLARMPGGLMQMVGEGGWQLSHGERSRVYLARALLQDAEVVVLDETFGALDPETLDRCVDCVLRRARTLLVIAHP